MSGAEQLIVAVYIIVAFASGYALGWHRGGPR
jgi:hypothetical protein